MNKVDVIIIGAGVAGLMCGNVCQYVFIIEHNTSSISAGFLADQYLENIIRFSPGFMYLKDKHSRYLMCNENFSKAAGLASPAEILGLTDYDLAWGDTEAELFRKSDAEALSGISKINFEEPQLQSDGQARIVLANKIPLYDNQKRLIGILGNYIDITDRKNMENDLLQAKIAAEAGERAKTYTHLLGGEISFTSEAGSGSDFYVILPFKIATEKQIDLYKKKLTNKKPSLLKVANTLNLKDLKLELKPDEKQADSVNKIYHILVIEDNIMARSMLVNYIKAANLRHTETDNGESALELAKNQHFNLILADVGLPGMSGMSGIEFAEQLRQYEKENNKQPVPIVGVTAHATTGRNGCLDAGMSAVTSKPLLKSTFNEILQEFLPTK